MSELLVTPGLTVRADCAEIFKPYRKQAEWLAADALFRLFLGGVGSGKSWALTLWCVMQLLRNPGVPGVLLGRTKNDLINPLLPELFGHFEKLHEATGVQFIEDHNKGQGYIDCIGGTAERPSRLWLRPYNRIAKIRGMSIGWGACDEIEWSEANPEEVWTVLTGRMRVHCPHPGLAFGTSPNGFRGITRRFVEAQREASTLPSATDLAAIRKHKAAQRYYATVSTSYDNPYLPDFYFDSLESMSKRRYRQEVLGKVLRPLNSVWQLEQHHIIPWDWRQHQHLPRVYGIDWGGQKNHVALMAQVTDAGVWVVADELVRDDCPRGQFQAELHEWIESHDDEWDGSGDPLLMAADRAVPEENAHLQRRFRKTRVRWMDSKAEQKVTTGIEVVRDMLDPNQGEPTLLFSSRLSQVITSETAPIIPAIRGYEYHVGADGQTTVPRKDGVTDHACFPAGTLVRMADGSEMAIERITSGAMVATPRGPRRVTFAASTGVRPLWRVTTSAGRVLYATRDHPVWVTDRGMTRVDALRYADSLTTCELRPEHSTAGGIGDTLTPKACPTAPTSSAQGPTCTATSGSTTTEQFRTAITYTTSTATPRTTRSATSSASRPQTTPPGTRSLTSDATRSSSTLSERVLSPRNGTGLRKAAHGTPSTQSGPTPAASLDCCVATTADLTTKRPGRPALGSAPTSANRPPVEPLESTTSTANAPHVAVSSGSVGTAGSGHAPESVAECCAVDRVARVFSLTVAGEHQFFANGVLVSNCDALRYIVMAGAHDPRLHGGRTMWRRETMPKTRQGDGPGNSGRQV